jgi:serine/threonine protein kinase/Tol biopolymer transport system component
VNPADRWHRVEELCHAALERDPAERSAFLATACAGDEALRRDVDALLTHAKAAERFLEEPAVQLVAHALPSSPQLAPGDVLAGRLQIVSLIGEGGMGQVYRATDTRLKRPVAIKILPPSLAADHDRLARFQREAEILASLNHPNIAAIYGLEEDRGVYALVMELVEGEDLSRRLASGPMPLNEALPIAEQLAEAIEAAHEQGIVHRDLKPANIMVRSDGAVKVLDFGIAKAMEPPAALASMSTPAVTQVRVIIGTAAYMSPEQARGKVVDKRSDIWAFGCVLFEMLTGVRAFGGNRVSDTLAFVGTTEPDFNLLPAITPAAVRTLVRRCLEEEPRRRLQAVGDARLEIHEALAAKSSMTPGPGAGTQTPSVRRRSPLAQLRSIAFAAVGMAAVATAIAWAWMRPARTISGVVTRFEIRGSSSLPLLGDARVAPDGSFIVYSSGGRLALRRFDRLEASPLPGLSNGFSPFVSPDSRWIGYVENFTLKKIAVTGGSPMTLAQLPGLPIGVTWVDDGTLIVATNNGTTGLLRVTVGGGEPTVLTTVDRARGEREHLCPSVLPGGRAILFTIAGDQPANAQIAMLDLETRQRSILIRGGSDARYVPSGHLVFASAGGLSAVRFDLARRAVVGDPVQVVDGVAVQANGKANASLTDAGTLVYVPGGQRDSAGRSLVWVDRQGHETPIPAPSRAYVGPRLSPDGTRIAVEIRDQENDIWMWDLARQTLRRLTFDPAIDRDPVWTPDGRRIIFASSRTGAFDLYARSADGTGPDVRLTAGTNSQYATSITPDGAIVIGNEVRPRTAFDIVRFPLDFKGEPGGRLSAPETVIETPFEERNGEVSPDGRFLAYQSNESGRFEIYVRPYPEIGTARWQVSSGGGNRPAWARGGRELFYLDDAGRLTVAPVETTGVTFEMGAPATLISTPYATPFAWRMYDVTADGQRFLMIKDPFSRSETTPAPTIVVIQNWLEELKQRVPAR